jgi:hypothetical protein
MKLQDGMSNAELVAALRAKLPGVETTDRELSTFALGVEVGADRHPWPAISLTRIGIDCVVAIEVDGRWVPVIRDNGDVISHIVEPLGVERAIASGRTGRDIAELRAATGEA